MNNSKDNNTEIINNTDITKKASLPILVSTGAIIFAGVISCDVNVTSQLNDVLNNNITVCSQSTQAQASVQDTEENKKKTSNKFQSYIKNDVGELFYDSDAEDDEAYYGNWDVDNYDDDEDFIIW